MEQSKIRDSFPERFDFFNLGRVEKTAPYPSLQQPVAPFVVVFRLTGDEVGYCMIAFDRSPTDLDRESMFIEMANILASKFVTELSEQTGGSVQLSPPEAIRSGERRHRSLVTIVQNAVSNRYEFKEATGRIGLRMTYLPGKAGVA